MTALVLLYLLHFQKVDMDNEDYNFDIQTFIELSHPSNKKDITNTATNQSLFA